MIGPIRIFLVTGSYGDPVRQIDSAYIHDNGTVDTGSCVGTFRRGIDYCLDVEEAKRLAKQIVDEKIAHHQRHLDILRSRNFEPVGGAR